ncbi:hypothetical protein MTO96_008671 [Rhipicephalus appendiculatus]
MTAYQGGPYYQDPQYNQAYAATDPGYYYDNTAFQEGVGDASYYDYNAATYDAQGYWDGKNPSLKPCKRNVARGNVLILVSLLNLASRDVNGTSKAQRHNSVGQQTLSKLPFMLSLS